MDEKRSTPSPPVKSNTWCLLLYQESDSYNITEVLERVSELVEYYYILHDKDIDESTGELKKAHYHVVCGTGANTTDSAIAKRLGIDTQWIQACKSKPKAKRYLVHADNADKYQYSATEVISSVPYSIARDEGSQVKMLLEWLDSVNHVVTTTELLRWSVENDCYGCLRRGANLFRDIVKEHNMEVSKNVK